MIGIKSFKNYSEGQHYLQAQSPAPKLLGTVKSTSTSGLSSVTIARSENQETRLITKSKPPTEQSNAEQGHKVFILRKPSQKATSSSFLVTRPPTPPRSVASTKPAAQQTGDHSSVPPNRTLHSYQFGNPALINARALALFGHDTQVEFLKGDCVLPLGHPKD